MKIELVSCAHVNGWQYYDVHLFIDGAEFTLVPVLYSTVEHSWYVKLPGRPLFVSALFSDLMDFLCEIIRDLFYL